MEVDNIVVLEPPIVPPIEPPQPPTPPVENEWYSKLVEATGGEIKDVDTLKATIAERKALQQKAEQLEANWNGLDAQAKRLHEMKVAGGKKEDIRKWFELQDVNVSELSDVDKVRKHLSMEHPSFSAAEIDEYIESKYGTLEDRDITQKMSFREAEKTAEAFLKSQILASENPESVQAAQAAKATRQAYETSVIGEISELGKSDFLTSITLATEGVEAANITIPSEVRTEVLNYTMQAIIQGGVNPKDREAVAKLADQMLFAVDGKRIVAQAQKDAEAKGYLRGLKANAGQKTTTEVVIPNQVSTAPSKHHDAVVQRMMERGGF